VQPPEGKEEMKTRLRLIAVILPMTLASCMGSLPSPTLDVKATVDVAVATSMAQERTKPTRESVLRAGREFFAVEADAPEMAGKYFYVIEKIYFRGLPRQDADSKYIFEIEGKHKKLEDTLNLLPLPSTPDGEAIRKDLADALKALARLRNLAYLALSGDQVTAEKKTQTGDSMTSFNQSWRKAREGMLQMLRQQGISMAELGR